MLRWEYTRVWTIDFIKIRHLIGLLIVVLFFLLVQNVASFMFHHIKARQQLLALRLLCLVECLDNFLDLCDRVHFEPLLLDRVHQLVHAIVEHFDVLLYLLVAQ